MKKIIYAIAALVLCSISAVPLAADPDVWVAVTVVDGRSGSSVPEYYGRISQATLQQLTTEVKEGRMFRLSDVFWTDDEGKVVYMKDAKKHGRSYGYTNDVVLRADRIYRIILVDPQYVRKMLNQ